MTGGGHCHERSFYSHSVCIPETAIEKFFQNGKPGLGRFASCAATSARNAVVGAINLLAPFIKLSKQVTNLA